MSSQTLWRTRMMFVSFNIAVKWVSYGNDGHFRGVWEAFWTSFMGIYGFYPCIADNDYTLDP